MNKSSRQQAILEQLESAGASTYQDLATLLGVAEMTIRRDVENLVRQGLVVKTLGGVQIASAPKHFYESELQQRLGRNSAEKRAVAQEALRHIQPNQTIFLDGGTTSLALAKRLASEKMSLTVVTYSALVCQELGKNRQMVVLSLGGQFDPASACFVGPTSEELARRFFVDAAFFSTKGLIPGEGTFESSIASLRIKQIIAEQASRVILLVDHTKFGVRALCKVLDITQIHEVITDSGTKAMIAEIERAGPKVFVAADYAQTVEVAANAS